MLEDLHGILCVKVKPCAKKTEILAHDPLTVAVKAPPENGKANRELLKFLTKTLKRRVEIIRGAHSRTKTIRVS